MENVAKLLHVELIVLFDAEQVKRRNFNARPLLVSGDEGRGGERLVNSVPLFGQGRRHRLAIYGARHERVHVDGELGTVENVEAIGPATLRLVRRQIRL